MTGTSVDGIDVACCRFTPAPEAERPDVVVESAVTVPLAEEVRQRIVDVLEGPVPVAHISELHALLGHEYARAINDADIVLSSVDAIAMHGQTVWHSPQHHTLQLGSGPSLAAVTGVPVIYDFRSADVALGGHGAPLVPMFDWAMLTHHTEHRVVLNLGGMANVTILAPNQQATAVRAFDTGPGNVLIDEATRLMFGKRFDTDGSIGRAGVLRQALFSAMASLPYFAQDPPKSTGREMFSREWLSKLVTAHHHPSAPSEDVVTTVTELTAWSIADHIRRYAPLTTRIIASGGGIHNRFLMERIAALCQGCTLDSSDAHGISSDAKEAIAFAYLGWRTLVGLPGNLPSVTGARATVMLGSIAVPR
jgi:anhydro-N-acetylmuramic acid kinase